MFKIEKVNHKIDPENPNTIAETTTITAEGDDPEEVASAVNLAEEKLSEGGNN